MIVGSSPNNKGKTRILRYSTPQVSVETPRHVIVNERYYQMLYGYWMTWVTIGSYVVIAEQETGCQDDLNTEWFEGLSGQIRGFLVDSGTSIHLCNDRSIFDSLRVFEDDGFDVADGRNM